MYYVANNEQCVMIGDIASCNLSTTKRGNAGSDVIKKELDVQW